MNNKAQAGTALFLGMAVVIVGIFLVFSPAAVSGEGFTRTKEPRQNIICDATIKNPLLRAVRIEQVDCRTEAATSCSFQFPFALFADEGDLQMSVDGKQRTKQSFELGEGATRSFTLISRCETTATHDVKMAVLDDNGQEITSKTVVI